MDDSTFRAYRNNPKFLSSILPLSGELDTILGRIFECDPRKRIGIPELRALILRCPRFTTRHSQSFPPTPPSEPLYVPEAPVNVVPDFLQPLGPCHATPNAPTPPSPGYPVMADLSSSSQGSSVSDSGSTFSAVSQSSSSSCESFEEIPKAQGTGQSSQLQHQTLQYFRNYFSLDPIMTGPVAPQPFLAPVQVC